jgi:hypothetical protein
MRRHEGQGRFSRFALAALLFRTLTRVREGAEASWLRSSIRTLGDRHGIACSGLGAGGGSKRRWRRILALAGSPGFEPGGNTFVALIRRRFWPLWFHALAALTLVLLRAADRLRAWPCFRPSNLLGRSLERRSTLLGTLRGGSEPARATLGGHRGVVHRPVSPHGPKNAC